jgi:group I intron endonuclease
MTRLKTGLIYKITNTNNGKCYIGKTTKPIQTRWSEHKQNAMGGSKLAFHCAIREHGPDTFQVEVIAESFAPFLGTLEMFFIKLYMSQTKYNGYNMTPREGATKGKGENCLYKRVDKKAAPSKGADESTIPLAYTPLPLKPFGMWLRDAR